MEHIIAIVENGAVTNIIVANSPEWPNGIDITSRTPRPGIGWLYANDEFIPPAAPPVDPPPALPRHISNLAFDLRLTAAERVAIELASIDNPNANIEARTQAAYLRVALERAKKAQFTNLDDPVTRAGVLQFEAAGLLDEGRALEILDAPVQDSERP